MRLLYIIFITLCLQVTKSSVYSNLKDDVLSFLQRSINNYDEIEAKNRLKIRHFNNQNNGQRDKIDARAAKDKARVIKKARNIENRLNYGKNIQRFPEVSGPFEKSRYHMDPVLNYMKRRFGQDFRRHGKGKGKKDIYSTEGSSSSSIELQNWKDEWNEHWIQKKFEALNSTDLRGDVVNMVAARPWGTPCGDPNQHDMPWGNCMLPMECDAEYRIYRGDYFCGRTSFICCALQYTNYDLYQGFDISFDDTSFSTDTDEKKNWNSKEGSDNKRKGLKKKRRRDRINRKRKIKRTIRKIIREMQKILNRAYRNGTSARKKKTKQLKKYIKDLKKKYRKERKAVKEIHELEMIKIDTALKVRLEQIRLLNENFVKNETFRDIVVNGTITKKGARMLIEAYPELSAYMDPRLTLRRVGGGRVEKVWNKPKDYLEYDIEYGLLYS